MRTRIGAPLHPPLVGSGKFAFGDLSRELSSHGGDPDPPPIMSGDVGPGDVGPGDVGPGDVGPGDVGPVMLTRAAQRTD